MQSLFVFLEIYCVVSLHGKNSYKIVLGNLEDYVLGYCNYFQIANKKAKQQARWNKWREEAEFLKMIKIGEWDKIRKFYTVNATCSNTF